MPAPLPPHPDFRSEPARPGEARPSPIWVSPDDWTRQQGELQALRTFKAEQDRKFEEAEQAKVRAMAEKGQIEEAFKLQNARYEAKLHEYATQAREIETGWLEERRNAAIAESLTGKTFAGADPSKTAAMVRRLLEAEVEAVREGQGAPVIRDRQTLRPAGEYLKERLESPEFAVFFTATHRGGAGADGARPAAASVNKPGDPNSAFAAAFLEQKEAARNARF